MSYNGHAVMDLDSHIPEFWDLDRTYRDYMDPEYRDMYAEFSQAIRARQKQPGDTGMDFIWPRLPSHPMGVYDDFSVPGSNGGDGAGRRVVRGNIALSSVGAEIDNACSWDPAIRLRDMDQGGIDVGVMFSSQSDGYCMLQDVGFESALHRAYHRFMNDYCSESEGRLRWLANATMRDIPETIAQLRYWAEHDRNFAGMFIPRACPDGAMLDHPRLHPLFAASQELDMPISIHGGPRRPPLTPWDNGPTSVYETWGGQYALAGLIGGGVFDLFPRLRFGIFESYGSWLPFFVEELDDGYKPGSAQTPFLKRKPSEIVQSGQFFCAIHPKEKLIAHAVEDLGEDIWLFATDYPHQGTPWPKGVSMIAERKGLSESAKVKMLGENAKRFNPRLAG